MLYRGYQRWLLLAVGLCCFLFSGVILQGQAPEPRPHVLLMLVDDWGWTDAGCQGSDLYETPNIDALAASGVRLTNAYSACTVCSPTRAAMMTGLYPARTHVTDWIPGYGKGDRTLQIPDWTMYLDHRYTTVAEAFQANGYRTAHVGKWHLTPPGDLLAERPYWPDRHGFDLNVGGNQYGAPGSYFSPFSGRKRPMWNMPPANDGEYLTDVLVDQTLNIMKQWKDLPFFIYLPFYNVHTPLQGKPDLVQHYKERLKPELRHTNPNYAAMVHALDQNVGRLLKGLEQIGIAENTIVVLTSDNGGLDMRESGSPTNNAPLRDGKGSVYEGGVRVPAFIRAPGVTPRGAVCDTPVITVDYFPTLAGLTKLDSNTQPAAYDGVDLTAILRDPSQRGPTRDLFWHYPHYHSAGAVPYSAMRSGDYRLIEYHEDGRTELYDLAKDLGEQQDLSKSQPQRLREMVERLHRWRDEVGAQMPTPLAK